jgi:hypothetical protein
LVLNFYASVIILSSTTHAECWLPSGASSILSKAFGHNILISILLASVLTSSSHLDPGLPKFLLPLVFAYRSHLGICSSSMCYMWQAHHSLGTLIAVVSFGCFLMRIAQSYICFSRYHRPLLGHKFFAVLCICIKCVK